MNVKKIGCDIVFRQDFLLDDQCCSYLASTIVYFQSGLSCGLYYKSFTIVIYERNAVGQYYKTTIVVNANYDRS